MDLKKIPKEFILHCIYSDQQIKQKKKITIIITLILFIIFFISILCVYFFFNKNNIPLWLGLLIPYCYLLANAELNYSFLKEIDNEKLKNLGNEELITKYLNKYITHKRKIYIFDYILLYYLTKDSEK